MLFKNDEELQTVSAAVHRLVHRALSLDGTCRSLLHDRMKIEVDRDQVPENMGSESGRRSIL